MTRSADNRRRGFTLVEVLATLVLVAVVLPVAASAVTLATRAAELARRRVEAAALAETKLTELLAGQSWTDNDLSGDFGAERPGYRWRAEVDDYDGAVLRQLTVTVEWPWRTDTRSVQLTTLVYEGEQIE